MIVCPVCEHPQAQGDECEVCGKRLQAAAPVVATVTRLDDLEQTQLVANSAALPVLAQPLPELELTRAAPVAATQISVVPELEHTTQPKAPNAPVAMLAELDTGRFVDSAPKTAAPGAQVTCRYCRNVQAQGAICERCGMRLPRGGFSEAGAGSSAGTITCTDCGTEGTPGRLCRACGARLPSAG
jgi:hypothetical protein